MTLVWPLMVILIVFSFWSPGNFISGEYVMGFWKSFCGKAWAAIVHDTRVVWNTADVVENWEVGQLFQRQGMFLLSPWCVRQKPHGGEVSAHHYFRICLLWQWYDPLAIDLGTQQKKRPLTELLWEEPVSIQWWDKLWGFKFCELYASKVLFT